MKQCFACLKNFMPDPAQQEICYKCLFEASEKKRHSISTSLKNRIVYYITGFYNLDYENKFSNGQIKGMVDSICSAIENELDKGLSNARTQDTKPRGCASTDTAYKRSDTDSNT